MKLKLVFSIFLLVFATLPAACGQSTPLPDSVPFGRIEKDTVFTADASTLSHDNRNGALAMYRQIAHAQANVVFSPFAVQTAMAMMYLSAQGDTATDVADAMQWSLGVQALGPAHDTLTTLIATRLAGNPNAILQSATRLWMSQNRTLLTSYGDAITNYFHASIEPLDFTKPEPSRTTINRWVAQQTANTIQNLLPAGALNNANLVQTAALRLQADWQLPFERDDSPSTSFYGSAGTTTTVMLRRAAVVNSVATSDYSAVDLPYNGDGLRMLVVMPQNITTFMQTLDANALETLHTLLEPTQVAVALPPFSTATTANMMDIFAALGLSVAISDSADFAVFSGQPCTITGIYEQAAIDVNETGTSAAAAAAVVAGPTAVPLPPTEITFDHPFFYAIHDTVTNTILFMGSVINLP